MSQVKVEPDYNDSKFQDEYYQENIARFNELDGNQPFKLNGNLRISSFDFYLHERYYLHPFKFGKSYYESDYIFDSLRFVNYSTNKVLLVPIDFLVRIGIKKSNLCGSGQMKERILTSPIHTHLNYIYKNAVPYISIKEILNEAAKIIGNKHIYFELHTGVYLNQQALRNGSPCALCRETSYNKLWKNCQSNIYECLFAHV